MNMCMGEFHRNSLISKVLTLLRNDAMIRDRDRGPDPTCRDGYIVNLLMNGIEGRAPDSYKLNKRVLSKSTRL